MLDADRAKSFPSAIAARYVDLTEIADWFKDPDSCVRACELPLTDSNREALKAFCNSAAGSGQPVVDTFLGATGLGELPDWAAKYRQKVSVRQSHHG